MRLPVPQGDLRPVLRPRHARDALLHRLPAADRAQLPGRRRRRDRPREDRGPARLRRRGRGRRARRRARRFEGSPTRARSPGSRASSEPDDLEGKFMAIAATDDTDVNIAVYDAAEQRAMLVNVVDVPSLCNFILPAIVRTGPLAIAISTAGASPALAKRMKREISELFGDDYAELAGILNDERGWAKGTLPTYQDRKAFFEEIVNGDPDPIELLRGDRRDELDRGHRRRARAPRRRVAACRLRAQPAAGRPPPRNAAAGVAARLAPAHPALIGASEPVRHVPAWPATLRRGSGRPPNRSCRVAELARAPVRGDRAADSCSRSASHRPGSGAGSVAGGCTASTPASTPSGRPDLSTEGELAAALLYSGRGSALGGISGALVAGTPRPPTRPDPRRRARAEASRVGTSRSAIRRSVGSELASAAFPVVPLPRPCSPRRRICGTTHCASSSRVPSSASCSPSASLQRGARQRTSPRQHCPRAALDAHLPQLAQLRERLRARVRPPLRALPTPDPRPERADRPLPPGHALARAPSDRRARRRGRPLLARPDSRSDRDPPGGPRVPRLHGPPLHLVGGASPSRSGSRRQVACSPRRAPPSAGRSIRHIAGRSASRSSP